MTLHGGTNVSETAHHVWHENAIPVKIIVYISQSEAIVRKGIAP